MTIFNKPESMCLAPWVHTYLSPQTERRLCCASREPAQNFQQYIDTSAGSGKYIPITLNQHWNSDHMKSVRRRMLAGETLPECQVCNNKTLNTDVYRDYFWHLFKHHLPRVLEKTHPDGYFEDLPISWDYRFSNLCNFKCRMCGDMLSSSWESEQRLHGMIDFSNPKNNWMIKDVRKSIEEFQNTVVEEEFSRAVEEHRVEEIYWVGGEPLMYEQHWRYMKRIIDLGDGHKLYARYNTNLSRIDYKGLNLYKDILANIRDWQICASIDGTQAIGEYIRTGLDYNKWYDNFRKGLEYQKHYGQMKLDFTLTLPGLFEIENMVLLAESLDCDLLAKVIFSFSSDIILSPLSLPRSMLNKIIDEKLEWLQRNITTVRRPMIDVLNNLKLRKNFEEEYSSVEYLQGLSKGKNRILHLEKIRNDTLTLEKILQDHDIEIYKWWKDIKNDN